MSGFAIRWIVQSKMHNSGSPRREASHSLSTRNSGWAKPSLAPLISAAIVTARWCPPAGAGGKRAVLRSPGGEAVLVHLQVAIGGAEQRRVDTEGAGAPQHVADHGVGLGAPPGLQILAHRGAVDAAALGQHRLDALAALRPGGKPGSGGDRLALGERR